MDDNDDQVFEIHVDLGIGSDKGGFNFIDDPSLVPKMESQGDQHANVCEESAYGSLDSLHSEGESDYLGVCSRSR